MNAKYLGAVVGVELAGIGSGRRPGQLQHSKLGEGLMIREVR